MAVHAIAVVAEVAEKIEVAAESEATEASIAEAAGEVGSTELDAGFGNEVGVESTTDFPEEINHSNGNDINSEISSSSDEAGINETASTGSDEGIEANNEAYDKGNSDLERELSDGEKAELKESGMSDKNVNECTKKNDGIYRLKTQNSHLEGKNHPVTGVAFVKKIIKVGQNVIEGVFPQFEYLYKCELPKDLLKASPETQFAECTRLLKEEIINNPSLIDQMKLTKRQVEQIMNNEAKIDGLTWHHSEIEGEMQLVDSQIHLATGHTGGCSIWGGGY